ncbi:hypothetical protein KCV01_g1175, partial [Aureobasidium melanogenum]
MLGFAVETGRRFVQDQHIGIAQKHPRDGDALPLSSGKIAALLAEHGIQPLRHLFDELHRARLRRGIPHLVVGARSFQAVHDVVANGPRHDGRALRHVADAASPRGQREFADRPAIAEHGAEARRIEAFDQRKHSGLAVAAGTDQRGGRPGTEYQVDAVEHCRLASRVAEGDVTELQQAIDAVHLVTGRGFLFLMQQHGDAPGSALRLLPFLQEGRQLHEGQGHVEDVEDEGGERADAYASAAHARTAVDEDDQDGGGQRQADQWPEHRADLRHADAQTAYVENLRTTAFAFPPLRRERLHQAYLGEHMGEDAA